MLFTALVGLDEKEFSLVSSLLVKLLSSLVIALNLLFEAEFFEFVFFCV